MLAVGKATETGCACRSRSSTTPQRGRCAGQRRDRRLCARATHETCIVDSPVDCPPRHARGAALDWASARGVARRRGPLPGAYNESHAARSSSGAWRRASYRSGASTPRRAGASRGAVRRRRHAGGTSEALEKPRARARRWGHRDARRPHDHPRRARSPGDGLSRGSPADLGGEVAQLALDYRDAPSLAGRRDFAPVAGSGPIELAVLWVHTDGPAVRRTRWRARRGHRVAGSCRCSAPGSGRSTPCPPHVAYRQVLLGSVDGQLAHGRRDRGRRAGQRSTPTCRCRSSAIAKTWCPTSSRTPPGAR